MIIKVCHDMRIEPGLQPVINETLTGASANRQDGARLDIAANGFWGGTFERTFFDVGVFNPHAPSNRHTQLSSCYRKHEQIRYTLQSLSLSFWYLSNNLTVYKLNIWGQWVSLEGSHFLNEHCTCHVNLLLVR